MNPPTVRASTSPQKAAVSSPNPKARASRRLPSKDRSQANRNRWASPRLTGTLKFKGKAGEQSIKRITTRTGGHTPALKAFNLVGISENTTESITYAVAVELS